MVILGAAAAAAPCPGPALGPALGPVATPRPPAASSAAAPATATAVTADALATLRAHPPVARTCEVDGLGQHAHLIARQGVRCGEVAESNALLSRTARIRRRVRLTDEAPAEVVVVAAAAAADAQSPVPAHPVPTVTAAPAPAVLTQESPLVV